MNLAGGDLPKHDRMGDGEVEVGGSIFLDQVWLARHEDVYIAKCLDLSSLSWYQGQQN